MREAVGFQCLHAADTVEMGQGRTRCAAQRVLSRAAERGPALDLTRLTAPDRHFPGSLTDKADDPASMLPAKEDHGLEELDSPR